MWGSSYWLQALGPGIFGWVGAGRAVIPPTTVPSLSLIFFIRKMGLIIVLVPQVSEGVCNCTWKTHTEPWASPSPPCSSHAVTTRAIYSRTAGSAAKDSLITWKLIAGLFLLLMFFWALITECAYLSNKGNLSEFYQGQKGRLEGLRVQDFWGGRCQTSASSFRSHHLQEALLDPLGWTPTAPCPFLSQPGPLCLCQVYWICESGLEIQMWELSV